MNLVRNFDSKSNTTSSNKLALDKFILFLIIFIGVGVLGGFLASKAVKPKADVANATSSTTSEDGKTVGIIDKSTYKDDAEGTLQEGGIEGEGSFHLVRPGGDSQNVYLTSSTVDLNEYINKKIRVHGVTIAGEKAGWLMDVGYVDLLQ